MQFLPKGPVVERLPQHAFSLSQQEAAFLGLLKTTLLKQEKLAFLMHLVLQSQS